MTQFKVGVKVVCIKNGISASTETFRVKKGAMYNVLAIKECECGSVSLDIGIRKRDSPGVKYKSECCKCKIRIETLIVWAHSSLFLPIEEQEYKQVTYTKILDEIPACAQ